MSTSRDEHLLEILERATGLSGKTYPGGVAFPSGHNFFPGGGVKFQ